MNETLTLYVTRANGDSYVEFEIRSDVPDADHIVDREARLWLSRRHVVSVEMHRESGRRAGYRR